MEKGITTCEGIEDLLNNIPAVLYEYALYDEGENEFIYMSPPSQQILGHRPEYFLENMNRFWDIIHPEDLKRLQRRDIKAHLNEGYFISEIRIALPSGEERWIQLSSKPGRIIDGKGQLWNGYIIDITNIKNAEAEIKVLQDILPMCSSCKKIRNDKGYWEQVENYIAKHSNVQFSHGICEDCIEKLYGADMLTKIKNSRL